MLASSLSGWGVLSTIVTTLLVVASASSSGKHEQHWAAASSVAGNIDDVDGVPAVFRNGAWDPATPGPLNAYIAALLSKDIYYKHVVDPHAAPHHFRRNFTLFAARFCDSMRRLGADDCEAVNGAGALVWALVRAGPSVLLVARGSNSPQNWITDVISLRTVNVGDFGGGSRGTNVAAGFYGVFAANRRDIVDRVRGAMVAAAAAAAESFVRSTAASTGNGDGAGHADAADGGDGGGRAGPRLWVFGHSLGGAIALMSAAYLDLHEDLPATGVYVFGCPRVGDESWAQAYRLRDVTMRLENTGDIVPTLPFGSGWRHVGSSSTIRTCRELPSPAAALEATAAPAEADAGDDLTVVAVVGDPSFEAAMLGRHTDGAEREAGEGSAGRAMGSGDGGDGSTSNAPGAVLRVAGGGPAEAAVSRRLLRGGGLAARDQTAAALLAASNAAGAAEPVVVEERVKGALQDGGADGESRQVSFPFPISIRDHMVQTYVRVMWTCLPDKEQGLVPGPEDVYGPYESYRLYDSDGAYEVEV